MLIMQPLSNDIKKLLLKTLDFPSIAIDYDFNDNEKDKNNFGNKIYRVYQIYTGINGDIKQLLWQYTYNWINRTCIVNVIIARDGTQGDSKCGGYQVARVFINDKVTKEQQSVLDLEKALEERCEKIKLHNGEKIVAKYLERKVLLHTRQRG